MQKKFDIVALGESLIDFVPVKNKDKTKLVLEGNAGGAPANVLAAASKLGRKTAFIGRVGRDGFGNFLQERIAETGVDISGLVLGSEPTTLAMVSLDASGNRSFSFYRNQTADVMLTEYEVDMELIESAKIFHFGTVSMTDEPSCSATLAAAARAKAAGVKISFDPNYRPLLWEGRREAAIDAMRAGIDLADYVKMSEEEAELLTGEADPEKAALTLLRRYKLAFAAVTLGPKGCVGISCKARVKLPTYDLACIDTTGAGDAFWGAALHQLLKMGLGSELSEKRLTLLLQYSNAAGSLATTQYGAIPALATDAEILKCIETAPLLV